MAKKAPRKKKKTVPRTIEVKSRSYGTHTRAARGTVKPAKLNKVLSANSKRIALLNPIAGEVHRMLKEAAGFFKEPMFWQKMLSRIHSANAANAAALLESIVGMELNSRYTLRRFGSVPEVTIAVKKDLSVTAVNSMTLHLKKVTDEYCYEAIALFFTAEGKGITQEMRRSRWFSSREATGSLVFEFAVPKQSGLYLICLRLHCGVNGVATDFIATQGMTVVGAGRIGK